MLTWAPPNFIQLYTVINTYIYLSRWWHLKLRTIFWSLCLILSLSPKCRKVGREIRETLFGLARPYLVYATLKSATKYHRKHVNPRNHILLGPSVFDIILEIPKRNVAKKTHKPAKVCTAWPQLIWYNTRNTATKYRKVNTKIRETLFRLAPPYLIYNTK